MDYISSNTNAEGRIDIGKGYSISVLWKGGEIDTIYGFETEYDAMGWIKEKSAAWVHGQKRLPVND